jgi:hypothetical protein
MSDPSMTRLERAIEQLGAEHEPPPGWQAKVLAAVAPRRRTRWWWFAVPAALAAAVAIALVPLWPRRDGLTLVAERVPGPRVMRGDSGQIRATARGGDGHLAIWVYRNGHDLVAVCPGHAACRSADDGLRLDLPVERLGTYQIVALTSATALPAPIGSYDGDLAAATAAGATSKLQELDVN